MRCIVVHEMFECPFQGSETYQLSELTSGADDVCLLMDRDYCSLDKCPLRKARMIKVVWERNSHDKK